MCNCIERLYTKGYAYWTNDKPRDPHSTGKFVRPTSVGLVVNACSHVSHSAKEAAAWGKQ